MKKAIYPGTFDPVTNGHLDVLARATRLFDHVTVLIVNNQHKKTLFTLEERLEFFQQIFTDWSAANVQTMSSQLTVDVAKSLGAMAIIRGLRAVSDFEYEFQMAQMNRKLDESIETVFFMPNEEYFFTSSHLVKHISQYELNRIRNLVPPVVAEALKTKSQASFA